MGSRFILPDRNLYIYCPYFTNIINQSETIVKNYNFGILSLVNYKRNFVNGKMNKTSTEQLDTKIYGKSDSYEDRINSLLKEEKNEKQSSRC